MLFRMTIQAPAKVNLTLRILTKRSDGYHNIESLIVPITLADEMDVAIAGGNEIRLSCDDPAIPGGPENLAWRAADAFRKSTGQKISITIGIRKNIPQGAGLGGGSSDAAAVIRALNQLCKTGLSESRMEDIAGTLGSDVPFFIRCQPSRCSGRGEVITPVGDIPPADLFLIKPPFPVSTAWAYQNWKQGTPCAQQTWKNLALANDLEEPVFQKYLLCPVIKNWLLDQKEVAAAQMSGSGSTLFAILQADGVALAQRARERFGKTVWTAQAKTLNAFKQNEL